ncbi:MAG: ArsI/CadI family heavy metal resistance metalloenzyme [Acidimicrobiia bacterium]
MSRVQLALNVTDVDAAVDFYARAFGVGPAKRRPGYANFEVVDPPLKLVLFEAEEGATLNHIGVEVFGTEAVAATARHLANAGLDTRAEEHIDCCHAVQDKVYASDPDGLEWEWYTVLADSPSPTPAAAAEPAACC